MSNINIVLQGKGGVGKSFISTVAAQYKASKGEEADCYDTDPVNATFAGFKALNVTRIEIMEGDEINTRRFDGLIERLMELKRDAIIDNGASSFVPLAHYLVSNHVPELLTDAGHQVIVHTVITGGQACIETLDMFRQLVTQFPKETLFVVWLNPYWGPVELEGKRFEQMKVYTEHKARVAAIIQLPTVKAETFGVDVSDMLQQRLTFDEALALPSFPVMVRHRLKSVRDQIYGELSKAAVL